MTGRSETPAGRLPRSYQRNDIQSLPYCSPTPVVRASCASTPPFLTRSADEQTARRHLRPSDDWLRTASWELSACAPAPPAGAQQAPPAGHSETAAEPDCTPPCTGPGRSDTPAIVDYGATGRAVARRPASELGPERSRDI